MALECLEFSFHLKRHIRYTTVRHTGSIIVHTIEQYSVDTSIEAYTRRPLDIDSGMLMTEGVTAGSGDHEKFWELARRRA